MTGYPLPHELVGGLEAKVLRANLRRRLVALDTRGRFLKECNEEITHFLGPLPEQRGEAPHLVFAVRRAGAQAELVDQFQRHHQVRDGMLADSPFRVYVRPLKRRVPALIERGMKLEHQPHHTLWAPKAKLPIHNARAVDEVDAHMPRVVTAGWNYSAKSSHSAQRFER